MREYQRTVRHLKDRDKLRQPIERAQGRSKYVASEQHLLYALCRCCAPGATEYPEIAGAGTHHQSGGQRRDLPQADDYVVGLLLAKSSNLALALE
jgi:hypothetical protein